MYRKHVTNEYPCLHLYKFHPKGVQAVNYMEWGLPTRHVQEACDTNGQMKTS